MESTGSITHCIEALRKGDVSAAQVIWERYWGHLVRIVGKKLEARDVSRRDADEEDIALEALRCLIDAVQSGRYEELTERNGLWKLLLTVASNLVVDRQAEYLAQKRGGGRVRGESAFAGGDSEEELRGIEQVCGDMPTAQLADELEEACRVLFAPLQAPELRQVAFLRCQGYSNAEIAQELGRSLRTVERIFHEIRRQFGESEPHP